MKVIDWIAGLLLIIGGLNWGLVGLFNFDLVAAIFGMNFGETSLATRIVYVLVGFSALWEALTVRGVLHRWEPEPARRHA